MIKAGGKSIKDESRYLEQTTEGVLDNALREVGPFSGCVDHLLKALESRSIRLTISVAVLHKRFGRVATKSFRIRSASLWTTFDRRQGLAENSLSYLYSRVRRMVWESCVRWY